MGKNTGINGRFVEIINRLYAGNKRAFAQHVGISPTVIENVVGTRQGKPSYDVLEKYAQMRTYRLNGCSPAKGV